MVKTKVLILFGGQSSEHEVSIMSARNIFKNTNSDKFEVKLAYIDRKGSWFATDSIEESNAQSIHLNLSKQGFVIDKTFYRPDVIFPVLHGQNGEDGMIAALGQLLDIAVVGCDMTAGAVGMDKLMTKQIAEQQGVEIVPYRAIRRGIQPETYAELARQLGDILFVKPTRSGSSVGVSRVTNQTELDLALKLAFEHDNLVLIEKAMIGRELEVAVLGNDTELIISPVGEILLDDKDTFYSYDSKYSKSSKTTTTTSAELPVKISDKIRQMSRTIYESLRCSGLSRIDFFLVDDKPFFNEINTFPGFTSISMYPKMIEEAGVSQVDLITQLIELAQK